MANEGSSFAILMTHRFAATVVANTPVMPIAGAVVRVSALPVARASEVHEATLAAAGVGEYSGQLDAQRQGQWELRFDVRAGSARFTDVVRAEAR